MCVCVCVCVCVRVSPGNLLVCVGGGVGVCVGVCLCVCVCVCLWVWPVCFPIKGKAYCRVGELHVESIYILNSCIVPADNPKPTVPAN